MPGLPATLSRSREYSVVQASTSWKTHRRHLRLQLNELANDRSDLLLLQVKPDLAQLYTVDELHKKYSVSAMLSDVGEYP